MSIRRKEPTKAKIKPAKWAKYEACESAVERGIRYGYGRAFKHDEAPGEEAIIGAVFDAVMVELSEAFDWE